MAASVEPGAGAGEEYERRRAEVGDPAREEDAGRGSASREAGVDADVVDGHEDHDRASDEIDRANAAGDDQGSSLSNPRLICPGADGRFQAFCSAAPLP